MRQIGETPGNQESPADSALDDGASLVEMLDDKAAHVPESAIELRVGIVLWPKFPLLSLAGLCDALRHAADVGDQSRQVRCSWSVLGIPGRPVQASCGIEVPVQESLASHLRFDYVALIGGLLPSIADVDRRYVDFLKRTSSEGVPIIGVCTGVFALAKYDLLDGKRVCVHPFHEQDWRRLNPGAPYVTHRDYLVDGNRLSCAGGISIIELAAELIRMHCGPDRSAKVIHQMTVTQKSAHSLTARRHALGYASVESESLRRAIILMERNIATPLEIGAIARMVDSTPKQLERAFAKETSMTPSEFYRNSRLKYGRWLLNSTDMPIGEIAFECGFSDAPHFIRQFQQLYGVSPGKLRRALFPAE